MPVHKSLLCALILCLPLALFAQESAPDEAGRVAAKSAWLTLTPEQKTEVMHFADPYKDYLRQAKSAALSAAALSALAQQRGFTPFTSPSQVKPGARLIVNNRDRAIAFVVVGSDSIETGSRVIAAHEDSPHINLKARPVIQAPGSIALFKTTLYGGLKKYQWSNLPLALVGRIDTVDGRHVQVNIGFNPGDPVFVIADNAPHSDSTLHTRTYTQVLAGEEMNPVAGSIPGEHTTVAEQVMEILRERYKIHDEDLVSAELELVPATQPADVGIDLGLTGSWGQDDKLSSYTASRAIFDIKGTPRKTALAYITNFEEIGSPNNTGAGSQFLDTLLTELVDAQKSPASPLSVRNAFRNAAVLSADCNDGVNRSFLKTQSHRTPPSSAMVSRSSAMVLASTQIPNSRHGFSAYLTRTIFLGRRKLPKSKWAAEAPSGVFSQCATWKSST